MRHRVAGRNIHRQWAHMVALRRNLASSLFEHGSITTTLPKAKNVQAFAERLITLARKGTLHARRLVIARLQDRDLIDPKTDEFLTTTVKKLFDEIAPKYADRNGGYTRVVHIDKRRLGDGGRQVVLQLIDPAEPGRKKPTNVTPRRRQAKARYALAEKRPRKPQPTASQPETAESPEPAAAPAPEPPASAQAAGPQAPPPADQPTPGPATE